MTQFPGDLLSVALRLPIPARAALAARLLDSLDHEIDGDAGNAWEAEIEVMPW